MSGGGKPRKGGMSVVATAAASHGAATVTEAEVRSAEGALAAATQAHAEARARKDDLTQEVRLRTPAPVCVRLRAGS